jgi:hypothetical protein
MGMIAFHGKQEVKDFYLNRIRAHEAADEIIHGVYWENGRGCAIGCVVHSSSHAAFETELGIPRMLARLEDTLFEGQRNGDAKTFPARFLAAIRPGADLSRVSWKFLHWILTEDLARRDDPRMAKQIKACADVLVPLTKGEPVDREAAIEAGRNARNAAAAAAAYAAAYAAAAADAAAAYAAAAAAADAAAAYAAAADAADAAAAYAAAADAADAAAAYAAAYAAARSRCYTRMANKLIELLAEA